MLDRLDSRCRLLFVRHFQHARRAGLGDAGASAVEACRRDDADHSRVDILKYACVVIYTVPVVHQRARRWRVGRGATDSLLNQRTRATARLAVRQVLVQASLRWHC